MEEADSDLVEPRPRGRPLRKFDGDALDETRSDHRCGECPKFAGKTRWCPYKATCRQPDMRVCRYGLVLINAKGAAERRGHAKAAS